MGKINRNMLLLFALIIAILIMGIGYASIESVTGEIEGTVVAKVQEGVFISNIEYVSDVDADVNISKIEYYTGTMMKSTIRLSTSNIASEIKYKITVYNNSEESVPFNGVVYDNNFYDNTEIIFNTSGFEVGQTIEPNETKEIIITFKYKENIEAVPENTILKSYLNFKMSEPNRMIAVKDVNATNYLTSTIDKDKIEAVKFERGEEPFSTDIVSEFDASVKQDESIIGYYTDEDNNGLYELTFVSEEVIYSNIYPSFLFYGLTQVKSIEFDNFSTWGAKDMRAMFQECKELVKLDVRNLDTSNVTNMSYMFSNCTSLTSLDLSNFDTSKVTSMNALFFNCNKLTKLNVNNFNTSKVSNISNMFASCDNLTELDVSKFDTSNVVNIGNMFYNCMSLTVLDINNFNTSKVTNMSGMFNGCVKLVDLDISNFNTSNVTNMGVMFQNCNSLIELNIANFNTSQVTNMQYMFQNCFNLKTIYVSEYNEDINTGWTTANVEKSEKMFMNCSKIQGGNGTLYDSTKVTAEYARIDKEEKLGYFTNIEDKVE